MSTTEKITIVVLNWNGASDTIDCVDSIHNCANYDDITVIIVDNNSDGGDFERISRKYSGDRKITIIKTEKNMGYCGGNNYAISYIRDHGLGNKVIILNNDTIVDKNFAKQLLEEMKNSNSAIVGATVLDYENKKVQNQGLNFNFWLSTIIATNYNRDYSKNLKIDSNCISGACFLIDLDKLDQKENLFDEDYFCYFEEVDLCWRIMKRGLRIAVSKDAVIYHKGSGSASSIKGFTEKQIAKNRFLVMKKNGSFFQKTTFFLFVTVIYFLLHILILIKNNKWNNVVPFIAGYKMGIKKFLTS